MFSFERHVLNIRLHDVHPSGPRLGVMARSLVIRAQGSQSFVKTWPTLSLTVTAGGPWTPKQKGTRARPWDLGQAFFKGSEKLPRSLKCGEVPGSYHLQKPQDFSAGPMRSSLSAMVIESSSVPWRSCGTCPILLGKYSVAPAHVP